MESKINKAVYGLADRSIFGVKIISGIVTGGLTQKIIYLNMK